MVPAFFLGRSGARITRSTVPVPDSRELTTRIKPNGINSNQTGGSKIRTAALWISLGGVTLRILIADDNPVFLKVLEAMLTNWGYDVVTACDGWEAWQILEGEDRPHLTILDWMMPGMTGLDVCRRVRSSSFGQLMYSLILTSKRNSEDLTEAMEAGADDYVTKPFNSAELRTRLRIAAQVLDLKQRVVSRQQPYEPLGICQA